MDKIKIVNLTKIFGAYPHKAMQLLEQGLSKDEIEKMKREAEANAEADKKVKEEAEKLNLADSLIFQTEKQVKEYGDKIPAEKKEVIEKALADLKKAHEAKDFDAIEQHTKSLNDAWAAASEDIYKATQNAEGNTEEGANNANAGGAENVQDVDFEEVK